MMRRAAFLQTSRICLTWTQRLIQSLFFVFSEEEYEEEEEEEEYEEEVQTNPDEYEIFFSNHSLYQKYARQICQYISDKSTNISDNSPIYWVNLDEYDVFFLPSAIFLIFLHTRFTETSKGKFNQKVQFSYQFAKKRLFSFW